MADTSGFGNIHSNAGGWNGLRFEYTPIGTDSSLFSHCVFRFGKATGDSVNCYGGVLRALQTDKIAFRHCSFENNYAFYWGGAIYSYKTNVLLAHCNFRRNHAGNDGMIYGYGGAVCYVSSEPDISHCHFSTNSSNGIGGAASFEYSRPLLMNSIFTQNFSALGGAIGFLRSVPDRPIANLLIYNNEAVFFGGGIASITASPVMTNLTIVNNFAPMGGGYYCNFEAHARLYNSILWGNTCAGDFGSQVWIWDVNSVPEFHHCAVQYGVEGFGGSTFTGTYNNCIESYPVFEDENSSNFRLAQGSPCIDAGTASLPAYPLPATDLDGHERVMYGLPDLGAYEYQGIASIYPHGQQARIYRVLPNPAHRGQSLVLTDIGDEVSALRLFTADGRRMSGLERPRVMGGRIVLDELFQASGAIPGLYLLQVEQVDGYSSVVRIVYQPSSR